jgi:predicted nuclease of predicted toxin-antitoxin system
LKIRADEHVVPRLVEIVRGLACSGGVELSSVREVGHHGRSDVSWVTAFAEQGGDAILSADTDFFKRHHQVVAIRDTGLNVIHLPKKWASAPAHLQAAHLLMWWPKIEETVRDAGPGHVWSVKWNISTEGELEQRKVDEAGHRKKAKKASRRR